MEKNNKIAELEEAFQKHLNEKALKGMENFMLFSMFNYFAYLVGGETESGAKAFKLDFFKRWSEVAKECNQIELEVINNNLQDSEEMYAAQLLGKPIVSTEDYQKKYDQSIEEMKKIYFQATGLE